MSFAPKFQITPALAKTLMAIEASRQAVSALPMTRPILESLQESARLTATHYSTQIEGNRLTQQQVGDVLQGGTFPNRERDEQEVRHYDRALDYVHRLIKKRSVNISESQIQKIHGWVMEGKEKSTPYRDGQNVIKESLSGRIIYMPPEAKDVAHFMGDLIGWVNREMTQKELPVPIVAAIAHYQFATIHPYYDGNGRTARLLTTLILHKSGYGLKGIYSLEDYYATNLQNYYDALTVGDSHNYYFGRADAEITKWVIYFCDGMLEAFAEVRRKVSEAIEKTGPESNQTLLLRELNQRQKQLLSLFRESQLITTKEIADLLKIHRRSALNLCTKWVEDGFLIQHGTSNKTRKYALAKKWILLLD